MFHSAHSVLTWAYDTSTRPLVKMSGVNNMREQRTQGIQNPLLVGLSGSDRHKQAANIIGMVAYLTDPAGQQHIAAKYGHLLSRKNLSVLTQRGVIGVGLTEQEVVYRLIKGYFDGKLSHRAARKILGRSDQYTVMVKSCLYDVLDIIHDRAMAEMSVIFERHGLIESTSSYA
jgi:hypothetical protein